MGISIYYLVAGAAVLFSLIVRHRLDSTYKQWGRVRNQAGLTGAESSKVILNANEMDQVRVGPIQGKLSDHYNPKNKSIRLSEPVFGVPSVAAMAVAAHETGHAIQDEVDYAPLEIRTLLAPVAAAGARFGLPAAGYIIYLAIIGGRMLLRKPPMENPPLKPPPAI